MNTNELIQDILVLVGRLYDENPRTFAPETVEVMNRWRPRFEAIMKDGSYRCPTCDDRLLNPGRCYNPHCPQ